MIVGRAYATFSYAELPSLFGLANSTLSFHFPFIAH